MRTTALVDLARRELPGLPPDPALRVDLGPGGDHLLQEWNHAVMQWYAQATGTGSKLIAQPGILIVGVDQDIIDAGKLPAEHLQKMGITLRRLAIHEAVGFSITVPGKDALSILARDEYNNEKTINFKLFRTETNPPKITIVSPYTSDDGQVMLEAVKPTLFIEGKISDESQIKSIDIGGVIASYRRDQLNPEFTASIDIANINKFTVTAEDIYGNKQETEFTINREGALLAQNNPMGKTWVVFIENSSYETFASLDGPIKDVSTVQRALANYQVSNVIHKKDMTKAEMEKFFNIELRDLLKTNQVKSLLIWYAGHGKYINDVGYWIPVDAKRDDEFTYFNINALKAGMQSYSELVHTLVISDACESGPSFYQAMRGGNEEPTCDNVQATAFKSAQVFTSAGYELAVDNSQFTQTFANTLINNKNACIPIETIVKTVTAAVANNNQQKPHFGKIAGMQDENGTFFFIAK